MHPIVSRGRLDGTKVTPLTFGTPVTALFGCQGGRLLGPHTCIAILSFWHCVVFTRMINSNFIRSRICWSDSSLSHLRIFSFHSIPDSENNGHEDPRRSKVESWRDSCDPDTVLTAFHYGIFSESAMF
jgi:hypothetical protein